MRKILLYPNPSRDKDFELTRNIVSLLRQSGIDPILQNDIDICLPEYVERLPLRDAIGVSDMIVCIGGDGTILRIASDAAEQDKPILGINAGKIGFLAELEKDELNRLEQILRGQFGVDTRSMLDVTVVHDADRIIYQGTALNDAVVTNYEGLRVVSVDFWVDDHFVSSVVGDGLIASTPTGSSAYSMSAGGPLVEPGADMTLVTPICPHSLFSKSFVLSGSSSVVFRNTTEGAKIKVTVDGIHACLIESGDRVIIRKSSKRCRLVRCKDHGFYDIIRKKLII